MFVASLVLEGLSSSDLQNIKHFGAESAVAIVAPWGARHDSADVVRSLDEHASRCSAANHDEPTLLAAFAVHAAQAPPRSTERAWEAVEEAAASGQIAAIGLLGPHLPRSLERGATPRQLRIAAGYGLPVLLLPRPGYRHSDTAALLTAARAHGVPESACVIVGLDHSNARVVAHSRAAGVVLLGGGFVHDNNAMMLAADYAEDLAGRLSFGLQPTPGTPDCTAFARAYEWAATQHDARDVLCRAFDVSPDWLARGPSAKTKTSA
jgi:predicted metal-dependent TIM-barrel fold hydrolase